MKNIKRFCDFRVVILKLLLFIFEYVHLFRSFFVSGEFSIYFALHTIHCLYIQVSFFNEKLHDFFSFYKFRLFPFEG